MSAFSFMAIPILVLVLVVRYHTTLIEWLSTRQKSLKNKRPNSPSLDLKRMAPYPAQPIKGRARYRVMMDIRKLDVQNWLTIDKNYMDEHRVRGQLLLEKKKQVLQCLPESLEACQEALEEVADFLCERFSNRFEKFGHGNDSWIQNHLTGEKYRLDGQDLQDALETAVRLTMEDLSILMINGDDEYYLAASATLFPVGWTVEERIGWTISRLHNPVPLWHQQAANSVSKFLAHLTPSSPMERSNYFIEVKRRDENLSDVLYRPSVLCEKELTDPSPSEILIRRERQTFRRLPRTGALVFGVKTHLTALAELPMQELQNLAKEMKSWPDYVGEYKGRDVWGAKVLQYCEKNGLYNQADEKENKLEF